MASSLVTRKILYEEIRRKYPEVETNSATVDFLEATRLTLAELLEIEPDKLSEKGQVNFEAEVNNFCKKVASFMRVKRNKKRMFGWKKDWFAFVIRFDQDQASKKASYENVSKSTQQRRNRKYVNETPSSAIQGSAALDYEDQDYTEAAQVLRELHKNPELGPQLLNLVKQIKSGKDVDLPSLKISAIKYACNVLGKLLLFTYLSIKSNAVNSTWSIHVRSANFSKLSVSHCQNLRCDQIILRNV